MGISFYQSLYLSYWCLLPRKAPCWNLTPIRCKVISNFRIPNECRNKWHFVSSFCFALYRLQIIYMAFNAGNREHSVKPGLHCWTNKFLSFILLLIPIEVMVRSHHKDICTVSPSTLNWPLTHLSRIMKIINMDMGDTFATVQWMLLPLPVFFSTAIRDSQLKTTIKIMILLTLDYMTS